MKLYNKISTFSLGLLLFVGALFHCSPSWGQSLQTIFKEAASGGRFAMPTHGELAEAQLLFELLLAGKKNTKAFEALLDSLHMEMVPLEHEGDTLTVIREAKDRKTGRGLYVHCDAAPASAYLMAPHSFTDIHTGRIALKLVELGGFSLTAFNTEKRSRVDGNVKLNQDMAHLTGTYFTALSHAIAKQTGSPRVVQLHGYEQGHQKTPEAREAEIIISSGQRPLLPVVKKISDSLSNTTPFLTRTYPDHVDELGGTTNITGRIMRKARQEGFIHVELSRPVRTRLNNDPETLHKFNQCITGRQ
ncbi:MULTISPECIES: hypothetical protein [unclassified Pseudodesulfovibrio]|uniref:hypothetical protein n=1 Tax=unclassified Pseudodesulfovibrio TaxID=2661612 RepID=UPI000FEB9C0F|nr:MULTISPECIES: hypothetical protein [unclassified Pseudodesulfovibrio]RWU04643.1 hypothetical protein DWB63_07775 [Pseudodesulfovibrio sp. S3]